MSHSEKLNLNLLKYVLLMCVIEGVYKPNQISASAEDIAMDYFWGPSLRSVKLTCADETIQIICYEKCGSDFDCIEGTCYCSEKKRLPLNIIEASWDDIENLLGTYVNHKIIESFAVDDEYPLLRTTDEDNIPEEVLTEHPTLRHHIAHFCPNLEDARKCIRTCMKVGKPAFCGKDHVCYCGHRYTSHDQEQPINIDDTYAKFRDLYEKYFGPQENGQKV